MKYELKTPVRKYRDRVLSFENNFELKKAFAGNAKAYSESKITSVLQLVNDITHYFRTTSECHYIPNLKDGIYPLVWPTSEQLAAV